MQYLKVLNPCFFCISLEATVTITECPICGNSEFKTHITTRDWLVSKEEFHILECSSCSFRFTQDAPSPEKIAPYYDSEEYVEHSDTKKGIIYSIYHVARVWMLKYKHRVIQKHVSGNRVLDVGSGSGYFADFMMSKGYDVTGVEISEKARALCKDNFGLEVFTPTQFLEDKVGSGFDLITLWHVLEHVYTLDEYFDRFRSSLSDEGKLILALPNSNSTDVSIYNEYWAAYDVPRHLWHFTQKTITKLADKQGFELIETRRLPLDAFFISMVSADYKKSLTLLPVTLLKATYAYIVSLFSKSKSSSLIYIFKKK